MVRVFAARRDQFAVDAVFDDLAVFEDDDPVEACDRGEAVRVEDHRHVMGVTEGVVDILHYGGEHVEAQRKIVQGASGYGSILFVCGVRGKHILSV